MIRTRTLTAKQMQKMLVARARHEGFLAACEAMRRVYSAPEHKEIRQVIDAVDHTHGDPSTVRLLRSELRAKKRNTTPDGTASGGKP
jgi:hypothetical protein